MLWQQMPTPEHGDSTVPEYPHELILIDTTGWA